MCNFLECKTFCFCFERKTGCITAAVLFLISGVIRQVEELYFAVDIFHYHIRDSKPSELAVIFTDDLEPTVTTVFAIFLLCGAIQEEILFVFSGIIYCFSLISRNVFYLSAYFIRCAVHGFAVRYHVGQLVDVAITLCVQVFLVVAISNYYKELYNKKHGRLFDRFTSTSSRTSFSNPTHNFP